MDNIKNTLNDISPIDEDIFIENHFDETEHIFNDCISNNLLPKWMMTFNYDEKKKCLDDIYNMIYVEGTTDNSISKIFFKFLVENIKTYEEYQFYINWIPYAPIFCSSEKYQEYKKFYTMLKQNIPLKDFVSKGILPEWIHDTNSAYVYLYLEYEEIDKQWKINENVFRQYMSRYTNRFL